LATALRGIDMHMARYIIEVAAFVAVAIIIWRMFFSQK
jgi:hypothetical protein